MRVESSAEDMLLGVPTRSLDRRFEALIFDWDGTAVYDRSADAEPVRDLIHRLCANGMDVAVVSGSHLDNVDQQLRARPPGPGRLYLCLRDPIAVTDSGCALKGVMHGHPRRTEQAASSDWHGVHRRDCLHRASSNTSTGLPAFWPLPFPTTPDYPGWAQPSTVARTGRSPVSAGT